MKLENFPFGITVLQICASFFNIYVVKKKKRRNRDKNVDC